MSGGAGTINLAGRTALVTGAAQRIGRGTALALAGEGVNVVVHYNRSADEAEQVCDEIRGRGVDAWRLQGDLADADAATALLGQAINRAGPIDFLVNNASVFPAGTLDGLSMEDLAGNLQVNALSPFLLARGLAGQDRDGAIVNFLDTRIVDYDRRHVPYHLSKRALFSLTRMMAIEFAPRVRVNAVAPGLILPPPGEDMSYLEQLASTNPLNRYGSVEAITDAVLFLLRGAFITGQVIFVDGGRHMKGSMYGC